MTFDTLLFIKDTKTGIKRSRTRIGAYQLSVIKYPERLYEAAIIDDDTNFVVLPGFPYAQGDTVMPGLEPEQVTGIMHKLRSIAGPQ